MPIGANMVLDKGIPVLSTYNSSAAAGVLAYRVVKWATGNTFDLATAVSTTVPYIGVVQENLDQVKIATGKPVANVRILGITKVLVTTAASIVIGDPVMPGAGGGVVHGATTGNFILGICVGLPEAGNAVAANDLIDVLLTPGVKF
jgi:hypothetical protein